MYEIKNELGNVLTVDLLGLEVFVTNTISDDIETTPWEIVMDLLEELEENDFVEFFSHTIYAKKGLV